jgi:hypothetical protein
MKGFRYTAQNMFFVRLNTGEDILLSLRKAVAEFGIKNAVILSAIGSVTSYHYHVVDKVVTPPHDAFPKCEQAADILNLNGFIIDGRVHAHITLSDTRVAFGGHLEEGCKVFTFSAISMAEMSDADFTDWDAMRDL